MKLIQFNDFHFGNNPKERKIKNSVDRVLHSGWFVLGKEVQKFEDAFANYLKVKYCIGVGNGLEALQISLMSAGVESGDEVITSPFSAMATTLAILAVGAKPIFVDTDKNGQLNVDLITNSITQKTKAVLPVDLYGFSANLNKLAKICKQSGLFLIEDACQAHGSTFENQKMGTFGDLGCFSFYPTKNLGALGDGGAIVTNNTGLAKICRQIRDYGQTKKYNHKLYGLNSRLDELQGAILKVKLGYLEADNEKRRKIAKQYLKNLLSLPVEIIGINSIDEANFHQFVLKTKKRNKLQKFLLNNKIPTLIHYPKIIPEQPLLKKQYATKRFTVARQLANEVLSLPCHPTMNTSQVNFICQKIVQFYLKKEYTSIKTGHE